MKYHKRGNFTRLKGIGFPPWRDSEEFIYSSPRVKWLSVAPCLEYFYSSSGIDSNLWMEYRYFSLGVNYGILDFRLYSHGRVIYLV